MLLQSAAMAANKLLENDKITAWIKQICLLGVLCKVLNRKTLSGETFCFWSNFTVFVRASDWPTASFLGMYSIVIFLQSDWSTLSKWSWLQ